MTRTSSGSARKAVRSLGRRRGIPGRSLIICTGAEAIWLGVEERRAKRRGISTCATCDGAFFRDEEVIVVGGGDSAMKRQSSDEIRQQGDDNPQKGCFQASKVMLERARNHPKIEILTHRQVVRWLSDDKGLTGTVIEDRGTTQLKNCRTWRIHCDRSQTYY